MFQKVNGPRMAVAGAVVAAWLVGGCTSINVRPVASHEPMTSVLIEENPKVWRSDFLDVLSDGFARHGIESRVIKPDEPVGDAYVVRYTARQKWDMAMYMSDATIWIYKNQKEVAKAVYHLRGGGGLSLKKWQGTQTKIDPVIDELLGSVNNAVAATNVVAANPVTERGTAAAVQSSSVRQPAAKCETGTAVDQATSRGAIAMGMTTNEVLKVLGRPDEMSTDGTVLGYGGRFLTLDEKSRLIAVSGGPSTAQ